MSNKANCYNKVFSSGNITDIILANPKGSFRIDPGVTGMPRATYWIVTTFTGLDGYLYATVISLDNMEQYTICYNQGSTPKFSSWREIATTESGTWTPTLNASVTNPTYEILSNICTWRKVGNIVFITCRLEAKITNAGSGTAYISGIPFPVRLNQSGIDVFLNYNIFRRLGTETTALKVKISARADIYNGVAFSNEWGANDICWFVTQQGHLRFSGWYFTD